jgi:hypothetical protein
MPTDSKLERVPFCSTINVSLHRRSLNCDCQPVSRSMAHYFRRGYGISCRSGCHSYGGDTVRQAWHLRHARANSRRSDGWGATKINSACRFQDCRVMQPRSSARPKIRRSRTVTAASGVANSSVQAQKNDTLTSCQLTLFPVPGRGNGGLHYGSFEDAIGNESGAAPVKAGRLGHRRKAPTSSPAPSAKKTSLQCCWAGLRPESSSAGSIPWARASGVFSSG